MEFKNKISLTRINGFSFIIFFQPKCHYISTRVIVFFRTALRLAGILFLQFMMTFDKNSDSTQIWKKIKVCKDFFVSIFLLPVID